MVHLVCISLFWNLFHFTYLLPFLQAYVEAFNQQKVLQAQEFPPLEGLQSPFPISLVPLTSEKQTKEVFYLTSWLETLVETTWRPIFFLALLLVISTPCCVLPCCQTISSFQFTDTFLYCNDCNTEVCNNPYFYSAVFQYYPFVWSCGFCRSNLTLQNDRANSSSKQYHA